MTPLQIVQDEIQSLCSGVRYSHKSFQDALFRGEATATDDDKRGEITPDIRARAAKQCVRNCIRDIRLLQRVMARMRSSAKVARTRGKLRGWVYEPEKSPITPVRRQTSDVI